MHSNYHNQGSAYSRFFIGLVLPQIKALSDLSNIVPSLDFCLLFYQENGKKPPDENRIKTVYQDDDLIFK